MRGAFMDFNYENFVFSGGGVLGIAYIGMLEYLYEIGLIQDVKRVAGTSAGAITACITAFNLSFEDTKNIADQLDFRKVTATTDKNNTEQFNRTSKAQLNKVFGNIDCVYRLIKQYGWYSSNYFYDWIKAQIALQFDPEKKAPPYTFADFMNTSLHKDNREFKELYIIGTDVSNRASTVFSFKDTPYMEVAEAVRISMSVPLLFEAIETIIPPGANTPQIYVDGGLLYNYPISLFDEQTPFYLTLGAFFENDASPAPIENFVKFISSVISCTFTIQSKLYHANPENKRRSIPIFTGTITSLDFDVEIGDATYNYLYQQGYNATKDFFEPPRELLNIT